MAIHYAEASLSGVLGGKKAVTPDLVKVSHCKYGTMMYFPHDHYIGGSLEKYGAYNEEEAEFLLGAIPVGGLVVEVGANIGCHTLPMAKKVGPSGHVIAFEPQRVLHHMLCGNLALNVAWNVTALQVAIGSTAGVTHVPTVSYNQPGNFGRVSMSDSEGEPVPLFPLDHYALPVLHLLKIDVEGMELEVLQGAAETIKRTRPLIYCENDREDKKVELIAYLRSLDYDLYWHYPMLFTKDNYWAVEDNIFPSIASHNMACIPRERAEQTKTNLLAVE